MSNSWTKDTPGCLRQIDFHDKHDLAFFNAFMAGRSYVNDSIFSSADTDLWQKGCMPPADRYPHAYRWYVHVNSLMNMNNQNNNQSLNYSVASTINHRKRSGSSLIHLKKEARQRASRRETTRQRILFNIQITPRNAESSHSLWEKIKQTVPPEGIIMKWGEHFTWLPKDSKRMLQTTFVACIGTDNPSSNGDDIVNSILERYSEDVEFCEIISQTTL